MPISLPDGVPCSHGQRTPLKDVHLLWAVSGCSVFQITNTEQEVRASKKYPSELCISSPPVEVNGMLYFSFLRIHSGLGQRATGHMWLSKHKFIKIKENLGSVPQ